MTERRKIIILCIFYFLGIGGGWLIYEYKKPSEEQRLYLRIDHVIRTELCKRIATDLKDFEASPLTFKRSSLKILITESTAVAQTRFELSGDEKITKFRGINSELIVSECLKEARRWITINSVFPEQYELELTMVGRKEEMSTSTQAAKNMSDAIPQERRLALVIGNSNYQNRPLKNPVSDAKDMGGVLKNAGFSVIELYDADLKGMRDAIKTFSIRLKDNDVGLLYYSGHGIEFSGRNYFLPIDSDIKTEDEIPRQGFDATAIIEKMSTSNVRTSIFIFDACRNAPVFSSLRNSRSGLALVRGSNGSIVAFSAAPGQVALDGNGRNSPYTSVLLRQIQIPNKKIEDVVKDTSKLVSENTQGRQVPWYNSSLVGDFYFIKK